MGRKKSDDETKPKGEEKKDDVPEVEDTPIVKELKEIDDKYLELEKEYEKERHQLRLKFQAKQNPILDQRTKLLTAAPEGGDAPETGTPALSGFWLKALKNHPAFEDIIEEWDEPVLEYLSDVTQKDVDEADPNAGFKITFKFAANPYFTNETLVKEYTTEEESPYTGDMTVKKIDSTEIDWKEGKNITIAKVAKKVKGGGAKKAKQKKEKDEPRDSFFRGFFRSLADGMDLPDDINLEELGVDEDEDEEEILQYLMENDHEGGSAIKDSIIPFAVRWYTGEAAPERDDDDEESEEEEGDDDDPDDSEDESPPPTKKGGKKKGGNKPSPKNSPGSKPKDAPKEECKQQ